MKTILIVLLIIAIILGVEIYISQNYPEFLRLGPQNIVSVVGTVRFIDLEGGFWGIAGDDGKNYDPINLPGELKKDSLRAEFRLKIADDQVGFHMWGIIVEIKDYKILGQESGIIGIVTLGPMCPVIREGEDCPDKPYEADIVIKNKNGTKVIKTVRSDSEGKFRIALDPGEYLVVPQPEGDRSFPHPGASQLVVVEPGKFIDILIQYDTGIR